jgi:hypothetical protein
MPIILENRRHQTDAEPAPASATAIGTLNKSASASTGSAVIARGPSQLDTLLRAGIRLEQECSAGDPRSTAGTVAGSRGTRQAGPTGIGRCSRGGVSRPRGLVWLRRPAPNRTAKVTNRRIIRRTFSALATVDRRSPDEHAVGIGKPEIDRGHDQNFPVIVGAHDRTIEQIALSASAEVRHIMAKVAARRWK